MKKYIGVVSLLLIFVAQSVIAQIDPKAITIIRDKYGVPNIFAKTDAEVAYGLAWAHCEDDFKSIQENMILTRARMAEIKGVEGAKMDYFVQFLRARELAITRYKTDLSPQYRKVVESYAAGVTAFANAHPDEMVLDDLLPFTGEDVETGFVAIFSMMSGAATALQAVMEDKPFRNLISYGSNGFAFNKNITADSSTYLLNDPHWLINGNITFYEAQIFSEEGWRLNGGFYPLMPMPANAVTANLGWNLPFNYPDLVDIYELEVNPEDEDYYLLDGRWRQFEIDEAVMRVKTPLGKLKVKKELLWTVHGPAIRTDAGVFALRINAIQQIGASEQLYRMSKARDFGEFKNAMNMQRMPIFNIVYADRDGHIMYICNGLIPVRNPNYFWQDVVPGNTTDNIWTKFYPLDSIPQVIDPKCGYVYNTNSSPFLCSGRYDNPLIENYPATAGYDLNCDNDRAIRFRELVEGKTSISFDEMKAIKYDLSYPTNGEGAIFKTMQMVQRIDGNQYPDLKDAIDWLKSAELNGKLDNTHNALVAFTFYDLIERLKVDRLDFMKNGLHCPEEELIESIRFAKSILIKHYGTIEVPLASVHLLVRGDKKIPAPGLSQVLNSCDADIMKDGYLRVNRNSSFLQMARYTKSGLVQLETVHTYGSSNRPESPHYSDQMELNTSFQTKKMSLDPEVVKAGAVTSYHPEVIGTE